MNIFWSKWKQLSDSNKLQKRQFFVPLLVILLEEFFVLKKNNFENYQSQNWSQVPICMVAETKKSFFQKILSKDIIRLFHTKTKYLFFYSKRKSKKSFWNENFFIFLGKDCFFSNTLFLQVILLEEFLIFFERFFENYLSWKWSRLPLVWLGKQNNCFFLQKTYLTNNIIFLSHQKQNIS